MSGKQAKQSKESDASSSKPIGQKTTPHDTVHSDQPSSEIVKADAKLNSYDAFPYPSNPFPQTHPDRLSMVARLFGLTPPAPSQSRILEIGCAAGGNLIPLAEQLPQAKLLGIDLSTKQIEAAQSRVDRLQLTNIELRAADIREVRTQLDEYDYIICHGVFSWVPAAVRDAILEVCRDHLSPQGVAFVSYNTYPGWHMRGLVRDMMCYHDNESLQPQQRVGQARALLAFLAESVSAESSAYGMLLKSELELLSRHDDGYLFHEHLEADNEPCYFHQFMEQATSRELQYLGDSSVSTMWIGNFPDKVAATLQRVAPDIIQREQYTDFVRNRLFRQTLLCHANVQVDRSLTPARVLEGRFAGRFVTDEEQANIDLAPNVDVTFQSTGTRRKLTTRDPLIKAAMVHLSNAWPASIPFADLFQTSRLSLGTNQIEEASRVVAARDHLATHLLRLLVSGMLELKFESDRFQTTIPTHPKTTAIARDEALHGRRLTNLRHEVISADDFVLHIVKALDGTRDRQQLLDYARDLVKSGTLVIHSTEGEDEERLQQLLGQAIEQALQKMSRQAMFVG